MRNNKSPDIGNGKTQRENPYTDINTIVEQQEREELLKLSKFQPFLF